MSTIRRVVRDLESPLLQALIVIGIALIVAGIVWVKMRPPVPRMFETGFTKATQAITAAECDADPACVKSFDPSKTVDDTFQGRPVSVTAPARRSQ